MKAMKTISYTYWKSKEFFLGFINDYPDYITQGETKEELQENLKDLLVNLESNEIPYIRKVEQMQVA
jgi:predicted RNase H-like HicB family nuclease